jgi:transposase
VLQEKGTEIQAVLLTSAERPGRIFRQDERRVGLLPVQRRRITVSGVKPVGVVQYQFENFYLYGAAEPTTGESFFLELPQLNTVNFQIFLNEFAHHYPETLNIVLMDNGSGHTAKALVIPAHIVCLFLPPSSPELHPIERLWQDLNARLAWLLVAQLEALERHVETILRQYSRAAIQSLTSYPYVVHAVNALFS